MANINNYKRDKNGRLCANTLYHFNGKSLSISGWAKEYNVTPRCLRKRIEEANGDVAAALSKPQPKSKVKLKESAPKMARDWIFEVLVDNKDKFIIALQEEFDRNPLGYFKTYCEKFLPKEGFTNPLDKPLNAVADLPIINIQVNNNERKQEQKIPGQRVIDLSDIE